ncbi:MAG: hypothetical protein PVG45_11320 [Gammaproteobacteria bacterium]
MLVSAACSLPFLVSGHVFNTGLIFFTYLMAQPERCLGFLHIAGEDKTGRITSKILILFVQVSVIAGNLSGNELNCGENLKHGERMCRSMQCGLPELNIHGRITTLAQGAQDS